MLAGCVTSPSRSLSRTQRTVPPDTTRQVTYQNTSDSRQETTAETVAVPATTTQLVAHQEEVPRPHAHADLMVPLAAMPEEETALTLQNLEGIALANNPTLVQANAQFRGEQGAAYQAGLPFNPVIGYTGEQIGVNGTAGELQGGFVAQEIVTGGKLRLSRAKWAQRAQIAATNAQAQQQRVLNDVQT